MQYRLALDVGMTSIGWAILRLGNAQPDPALPNYKRQPTAIVKAGVRIFNSGRFAEDGPKKGASLAVARREARLQRRRRARLLGRKKSMMRKLVLFGFFPQNETERKALELLNPYELRAKGVQAELSPAEFARALFHLNQRRGFKSNRKTDKNSSEDRESSALLSSVGELRSTLMAEQEKLPQGEMMTVGRWLWSRMQQGHAVRSRPLKNKTGGVESYPFYIDRDMVIHEFEELWRRQAAYKPDRFTSEIYQELKATLSYQHPLRPPIAGRCTFEPELERAPLALPSTQRFRIYQELNHLRIQDEQLESRFLSLKERDTLAAALEHKETLKFSDMRKLLKLHAGEMLNLEDEGRKALNGNSSSVRLADKKCLGPVWHDLDPAEQDKVVELLLNEEDQLQLLVQLQDLLSIDVELAEKIGKVSLLTGHGKLSSVAIGKILPFLQAEVCTYDKAVQAAGYASHSKLGFGFDFNDNEVEQIIDAETGEITPLFKQLPYYGKPLRRHVAFEKDNPKNDEERYGKIANPTVHIGLNQIRVVVNALIRKYGSPTEVVVELARDLKQSKEEKRKTRNRQNKNRKHKDEIRSAIAEVLSCTPDSVSRTDIQKWILWEELAKDPLDRHCPYSGKHISARMLLSPEVEVEHILPFSQTLDDSLNNLTVALRQANRIKGNRTPWQAKADFERQGWAWEDIATRAKLFPNGAKRQRFAPDGYEQWLDKHSDFLARALNDTRYLARMTKDYLQLVCPNTVRVIPGQLTASLRWQFGLNKLLSGNEEKNRNDHRHHALDACVIGITDQSMLQRFARANASTRQKENYRKLVESLPLPWPTYRQHVQRALQHIWVSHRPDHGHQGAMMEDTSYGIRKDGSIRQKRKEDGSPARQVSNLIRIAEPSQPQRHGLDAQGQPLPYKGYVGGSNYCIEITVNDKGKWQGEVITRFQAYQLEKLGRLHELNNPHTGQNGLPLVMRLIPGDSVQMTVDDQKLIYRYISLNANNGQMVFAPVNEANVDKRNSDKDDPFKYVTKLAGSLQKAQGRKASISPIGELRIHPLPKGA